MGKKTITRIMLLLFAVATLCLGQQSRSLTNQDVVDLVSLHLSDDVIIDKIHAAKTTDFDTSVTGLKALKTANISDAVIRAMINPHPAPAKDVSPAGPEEISGMPEELGAYYKTPTGWTQIRAVEAAEKNYNRGFGTMVTGVGSIHQKFKYRDVHAKLQITEPHPTFYLRETESPLGMGDFTIVRFEQKKNTREIEWQQISAEQIKKVKQENITLMKVKRLSSGVFSLIPESELGPGEYLLCGGYPGYGYDFGISAGK